MVLIRAKPPLKRTRSDVSPIHAYKNRCFIRGLVNSYAGNVTQTIIVSPDLQYEKNMSAWTYVETAAVRVFVACPGCLINCPSRGYRFRKESKNDGRAPTR